MNELLEQLGLSLERIKEDILAGRETVITRLQLAQLLLADLTAKIVKPQ